MAGGVLVQFGVVEGEGADLAREERMLGDRAETLEVGPVREGGEDGGNEVMGGEEGPGTGCEAEAFEGLEGQVADYEVEELGW